jgi:hypothetical protein
MSVFEPEHAHLAIAIDEEIIGEPGRQLRIRAAAVERAIERARNLAVIFELEQVALGAERARRACKARRFRKRDGHPDLHEARVHIAPDAAGGKQPSGRLWPTSAGDYGSRE